MPSAAVRHVIRLELTLGDDDPAIACEVAIDHDRALADLARVIPALFRVPRCTRHVFASSSGSPPVVGRAPASGRSHRRAARAAPGFF